MKVFPTFLALAAIFLSCSPGQAEQSACLPAQLSATYGTELLVLRAEMEKNIDLCSGSPEFHFHYGYLLERLGKYDKALSQYQTALELAPDAANYYIGVADILRVKGDKAGAIHHYQLALAKGSTSSRARYNLIKLGGEVEPHADKAWNEPGAHLASLGKPVAMPDRFLGAKPLTAVYTKVMPAKASAAKSPGPAAKPPATLKGSGTSDMIRYGNFFIDRKEVSTAQYQKIRPQYSPPPGFSPEMPAVNISYNEAQNFASSLGKRLCTAEEWRLAVSDEDPDLSKMNLYKDYYSTPYPTEFGGEQQKIKNLIGNVAEWVANAKAPGFIGGHYHSASFLQATKDQLEKVVSNEGLDGKPYVGIRCCQDAR